MAQRHYDHTTLWQSAPSHRDTIYDSTAFDRIEHAANIESHYTLNKTRQYGSLLTEAVFAHKDIQGARALGVHSKRYGDTTTAPSVTMDNKVDWQWKRPSGAIVHLLNNTSLEHLPQEYLLREQQDNLVAHQEATKRLLQNDLTLSYERRKGRLEYALELRSELKQQGLEGTLYFPQLTTEADQLSGRLTLGHYLMAFKPSLTYRAHGWRFTASPRVVGLYQSVGGSGSAYGDQSSWIYLLEPMGSVRYEGRRFSTSLYASLNHRHQLLESLYAPYLFMNVDNVLTGSRALDGAPWWRSRQFITSLTSTYKDIFALFSTVYNATYMQGVTPRGISSHLYDELFYLRNYIAHPVRDKSLRHSLSMDKTFLSLGIIARLKIEHNLFTSEVMQQGHIYQGHGVGYSLKPEVEWQLQDWFSLALRGYFDLSGYTPDRGMSSRRQMTQQHIMTMYAKPTQALTLRASAHYYSMRGLDRDTPAPRDFVVGDLRAEYALPFATAIVDLRNVGSSGMYEVLQQSSLNNSFSTYRLRRPELLLTLRWKFPSKK